MMNFVTEAEAATKQCPHFKGACVASACMAWRFTHSTPHDATFEARELGPWEGDCDDTSAIILAACGAEIAQQFESAPRDKDGLFDRDTPLGEKIDEMLVAYYEGKLDAFKAANAPEGEGWEENTVCGDDDGMYVEWIKKGPPVGYCGYAR